MTNYQDETHWQNIFYCWAVKWYTNYILQYQTYLELERMAMMVVYTSTIEAMSAVPNETHTKYAPTSCKGATKQLI
jgi:hypothetical protein